MSITTNKELRKLFLYQVYLRSHTESGTINEFVEDLDRIKDLGVDVVYFMPVHPIGVKRKKGSLGCPYSISDYRAINPEYGTLEDFKNMVKLIHDKGMKVMIDVVYNHTSHDSVLLAEHEEYFMHDEQGNLTSKEPGWDDVQDFDYNAGQPLYDELTDTLLFWMKNGVDGFRFDVASFLPLDFLEYARNKMMAYNKDVILLSESVHGHYLRHMRNRGFNILSEAEIYQVFDMAYDYDVQPLFEGYLKGHNSLNEYVDAILHQEEIYPANYVKMRNLENHDFGRFSNMVDANPVKVDNWTAFNFFLKGSTMMYAGEEFTELHQPSLFEKEDVKWTGRDITKLVQKLVPISKLDYLVYGVFDIVKQDKDVLVVTYTYNGETVVGVFNVGDVKGTISLNVPTGTYTNLLNDSLVTVQDKTLQLEPTPLIFKY